jgi:Fe-Mn family superoxide dismutase
MAFQQPPLPYALGALAPFLSEEQMSFHYGKHHAAYYTNLNNLVDGKPEAGQTLDQIIVGSTGGLFNNAAQAYNHTFFWHCMTPAGGGGKPTGALLAAIERDFGSFEAFKEQFSKAAVTLFGSGWAWLAQDSQGKLQILQLSNADTPMKHGLQALMTVDVWEHAYYVDYRNLRAKFVEGFWNVVNWEFVDTMRQGGSI